MKLKTQEIFYLFIFFSSDDLDTSVKTLKKKKKWCSIPGNWNCIYCNSPMFSHLDKVFNIQAYFGMVWGTYTCCEDLKLTNARHLKV